MLAVKSLDYIFLYIFSLNTHRQVGGGHDSCAVLWRSVGDKVSIPTVYILKNLCHIKWLMYDGVSTEKEKNKTKVLW